MINQYDNESRVGHTCAEVCFLIQYLRPFWKLVILLSFVTLQASTNRIFFSKIVAKNRSLYCSNINLV